MFFCIYTFPIASFYLFVQLTDLGSKNPLKLAHFGNQDAMIFGAKVLGGSLDFNLSIILPPISVVHNLQMLHIDGAE